MIPTLAVQLGTLLAVAVGFGLGWVWRGWRDRELALDELRKQGIKVEDMG